MLDGNRTCDGAGKKDRAPRVEGRGRGPKTRRAERRVTRPTRLDSATADNTADNTADQMSGVTEGRKDCERRAKRKCLRGMKRDGVSKARSDELIPTRPTAGRGGRGTPVRRQAPFGTPPRQETRLTVKLIKQSSPAGSPPVPGHFPAFPDRPASVAADVCQTTRRSYDEVHGSRAQHATARPAAAHRGGRLLRLARCGCGGRGRGLGDYKYSAWYHYYHGYY